MPEALSRCDPDLVAQVASCALFMDIDNDNDLDIALLDGSAGVVILLKQMGSD